MTVSALAETEEATLRFLIADDSPFRRRLAADAIRAYGRSDVVHVSTQADCLAHVSEGDVDVLVVDWTFEDGAGLALVRRLRAGDGGESGRKLPIIMVADRSRQRDVDAAREAGVDEIVLRPFSMTTVQRRIMSIQRKQEHAEGRDHRDDSPGVQIRKGLVRMYVERLNGMLAELTPECDSRDFQLACAQLNVLAGDIKESLLISAATSLFRYVKIAGGEVHMDKKVIEAHLQAILKLAELPNCQYDLRRAVTQELHALAAKKLARAG